MRLSSLRARTCTDAPRTPCSATSSASREPAPGWPPEACSAPVAGPAPRLSGSCGAWRGRWWRQGRPVGWPEAAAGEVLETPPSGRVGSDLGGHELHRQVVRGGASSRHRGVAPGVSPVGLHVTGSRVLQVSETDSMEAMLSGVAEGTHDLKVCRARWLALPEHLRREPPAVGSAGFTGQVGRRTVSSQEEPIRPEGRVAAAAGERALRDLAAAPTRLALVGRWLRPEHFARAQHGELYAVMREMDAAGRAVDPVTVSWVAARYGLRAEPCSRAARRRCLRQG
jgi:hypothetical protein